eukprot:m.39320 g.39320  ORF g.39320 m.39320 type:complete len:434 (-) comp6858_c0_seq1:716-2017(-)
MSDFDIVETESISSESEYEEEIIDTRPLFGDIDLLPPNAVFATTDRYKQCKNPNKMNLGVGAFRNGKGEPNPLYAVAEAEEAILNMRKSGILDHEYPPIGGSCDLVSNSIQLALGDDSKLLKEGRAVGVQALSGTGSLRLVGEFLHSMRRFHSIYIPNPTWANHTGIFRSSGLDVHSYRYYDDSTYSLDFHGLTDDLRGIPSGQVVLFHACAHNPTGVDPSIEQWEAIAQICKHRNLCVVFDSAYLGFASGDIDQDAAAMRLFADMGIEFFVCMSYSKNMGLYDERCGAALYFSSLKSTADKVLSHLKVASRVLWSVPPQNGACIVNYVLGNEERKSLWKKEVNTMASRILSIRQELYLGLKAAVKSRTWEHIINQKGMFSYTGLSPRDCQRLEDEFSIYMLSSGRISVSGISDGRVPYLVLAISTVLNTEED